MKPETHMRRYRRILREISEERGDICEACGAPAKYKHHIIPVSETGIHAELVYDKANLLVLCDDCHLLMHPGIRRTEWMTVRRVRGRAILRS